MEELDLKEILQAFLEKKFQIIIIISLAIIAGCIYTLNYVTPMYKSSTKILLGRINSSEDAQTMVSTDNQRITQSDISMNASLVSTYSELIKSESLIKEVKNRISTDISEEDLRKSITVKRVSDTELIEIIVTNIDPSVSCEVANEIAQVFRDKIEEIYKISNVFIIDKAMPAIEPYNINHVKDILIFVFIGCVVSAVYIVVYNLLDTTIKTSNDIEKLTNLKNLISIPLTQCEKSELITFDDSKSIVSESFRTLRTNVQFSSINDKKTKTYLVTSCFQSEGKSYISSNLAITFAQAGKKVVLIDSDMRRGRQAKIFNFPNEMGLSNYISNIDSNGMEINYDISRYIKETEISNLNIITSGNVPPNPSELLASPKVPELIKQLKEYYDVIIFDGAPVLPITDSLILTRLLDSTILVARYNKTKKDDIIKAKSDLENVGGKIIGTCLNAVAITSNSGDLNYYYYYGERESNKTVKEKVKQNFRNFRSAFKKLKKLPKINKSKVKRLKIIEDVKIDENKPVVRDVKRTTAVENEEKPSITVKEINELKSEEKKLSKKQLRRQEKIQKEEKRLEELKKQKEARIAEEKRQEELRKAEEARIAEEKKQEELRKAEEARIAEEKKQEELRKAEEARIAEEKRQEELRKAEEARIAEERRQEELRKAEEARIAEEKRQEELRRIEEARIAEEKRQEELRKAEEARIAEEKRQEELRKAEEARIAEEKRQEELRRIEEARIAEEKRQEELRKAEEARIAEEKRQEELRKAEEARIAEEKRQEELRKAEEARIAEEKRQEELRKAEEARIAEEKRQEKLRKQEEKRIEKEKKKEERKEKLEAKVNEIKNKAKDFKKQIEKDREEKKIRKTEKKIKAMEEQAKNVREKIQKAEEEKNKMFGRRLMFEIEDDELDETTDNRESSDEKENV